jgi:hypothetical protein
MSLINPYANKPFLNAQMASCLQYSYTQEAAAFTVAQTDYTLTVSGLAYSLNLGSYVIIPGNFNCAIVQVIEVLQNGDVVYRTDIKQTVAAGAPGRVDAFNTTVQNALNTFLSIPNNIVNYYQFIASVVKAVNSINAANPTTASSGKNGLRVLATIDDGSVLLDTGRCTFSSNNLNQIVALCGLVVNVPGNIYVNYSNKIFINVFNPTSVSNNANLAVAADTSTIGLTSGTAGGNSVNENHHSRPEMLSALFKDSGIGYAKRYSSSTSSQNYYLAQRMGISTEENLGCIRVNVPVFQA